MVAKMIAEPARHRRTEAARLTCAGTLRDRVAPGWWLVSFRRGRENLPVAGPLATLGGSPPVRGVDVTPHAVTRGSLHLDAAAAVAGISSCALCSPGRVMRPQPRPTSAASRNGST